MKKARLFVASAVAVLFLVVLVQAPASYAAVPADADWAADVAEKVLPSVVNISSTKTVTQRSPLFMDPFFREFFGGMIPQEQVQRSLGSGVIISPDGYIVTNNHVVGGADKVEVRLADGRVFPASIAGSDPKSDLALIRISATGLPAVMIGDSTKLRIGEFVLAVGNPFGLEQTVTMGIISALGRSGLGITDYENFIQTDAAINPGNSGGALVNVKGELIGINTAILSRSGGSVGIGFAIPVNLAMSIKKSIEKYGKVLRGWLGVTVQEITPELAQSLGLSSVRGALVNDVGKGSPADRAGIRRGDVIVEIDGQPVVNTASMRFLVSEAMPGSTVRVKVLRDGKEQSLPVVVGDLSAVKEPEHKLLVQDNKFLGGATVAELTPAIRESMQVDGKVQGVVVVAVTPNSAAAGTGIRQGDVILSLNGRNIRGLDDFKKALPGLAGSKMSIGLYRQGAVMNMTIIR
jgi:Do/DeqQ family serine protease